MHSWPITVLSPISTSPSWQRILVPSPIQTKRPKRTVPRLRDLDLQAPAEEDGPVGLPAPAGAGEQAPPEVAPERAARTSASASGCGRRKPDQQRGSGATGRPATLDSARPMAEAREAAGDSLAERLVAGDKRALARAISLVENRDPAGGARRASSIPRTGKARIVGFTGPPGVGKSTLIGALTGELRKAGPRGRGALDRPLEPVHPGAPCSATGSASPTTSSTPASSSARWPRAARSAASPRRRCRRRC